MDIKKARKLGFFAALTILLGSIVGVGIFFRNIGVSAINEGNGVGILITWIFGGFLALFAALSFSEIGTLKNGKLQGLSGWANRVGGSKFGYMVRVMYSMFYFPVITVAIAIFAAQFLLVFIHSAALAAGDPNASQYASNNVPLYGQILIGLALMGMIFLLQFFSTKTAGHFQILTTILKFIPIVLVIAVGIILVNRNFITPELAFFGPDGVNGASPAFLSNPGSNGFLIGQASAAGIFLALPGVLFTFDAFLIVASLTKKVKGGEKTVSKVVIIGMSMVIVFYLLVSIASILNNQGALQNVLINTLGVGNSLAILVFFNLFLFISAVGVLNGIIFATTGEIHSAVNSHLYAGSEKLIAKFGQVNANRIFMFIVILFWALVMYIPSIVLNTDKILDGISLVPTVVFFGIYASVTLLYLIKRQRFQDTKKLNNILLITSVILFCIGSGIGVVGFYVNIITTAALQPLADSGLGLFGPSNRLALLTNSDRAGIVFSITSFAFVLPILNFLVVKLFNRQANPLVVEAETQFIPQDLLKEIPQA